MNTPIRPTCSTATVSLLFGILCWFVLPFVGAVIAVIAGHMARGEIRRAQGGLEGDGMAVAGLVLGYVHLGLWLLALMAVFLIFGGLAAFGTILAHHHPV
ncbi:MAG: DUF4190 domain-containing protein [Proteobacteria bacterium]|nr:DUF4190 domain-containing protein [Pseudomonadota bacterium]